MSAMKSSASPREAEQNAAVRSARRERIARTLTFWLRPRFVLQVVNRFQKVAGFDRAIALASSALTALIPLAVVASAFSEKLGGKDTAQRIIDRYDLTGGGAEAVRDIFAPASAAGGGLGLAGAVFVLLALLSFARMMQRLFEQAWELEPLSVRNTPNQLLWLCGLSVYLVLSGFLHAALGERPLELAATLLTVPLCGDFADLDGAGPHRRPAHPQTAVAVRCAGRRADARVHARRAGLRAAPLQHLCDALRRGRSGVRDDLGALLHRRRAGRLDGGRPRGPRRARTHPARRAAAGRRGPPPVGRDHRRGPLALGRAPAAHSVAPGGPARLENGPRSTQPRPIWSMQTAMARISASFWSGATSIP